MSRAFTAALTDRYHLNTSEQQLGPTQLSKPPAKCSSAPRCGAPSRFLLEALQELREQLRDRYGAPLLFCLDAPAGAARAVAAAALQAGGQSHVDLYHCKASPDSAEQEACCPSCAPE